MRMLAVLLLVAAGGAHAEYDVTAVYRCGDKYDYGLTDAQVKERGCIRMGSKKLSEAEREKYLACQMSAGQAPTEIGAQIALRACRERFEQKR
jgi:hypothetical protein